MAQTINIQVTEKVATTDFNEVVSFNHNTYQLHFDLDDEWNEFEHRIAVVMWAGGCAEQHFMGADCEMPAISDEDCDTALVGVYSTNGEKKLASSFVRLRCVVGAHGMIVSAVQPGIHEQILSFLNRFDWTIFEKRVKAGVYSTVNVNSFGIVTEGWNLIEIGTEGQIEPSSRLARGGIFFRLNNGVYTLYYYTGSELVAIGLGGGSGTIGSGVSSVNGQTGEVTLGKEELGLSDVAFSGSYNDLTDKPAGGAGSGVSSVNGQTGEVTLGKDELGLSDVAFSGSYNDLTDKPAGGAGGSGVSSVNGQTGEVTLGKDELGLSDVAFSGSYNDLTDKPAGGEVASVNGKTGAVIITKGDVGLSKLTNSRQMPLGTLSIMGKDLNTITDTGVEFVTGTSSKPCTNVPVSSENPSGSNCQWAVMTLSLDDYDDNIMQIAFSVRSDCAIQVRNCTTGSWGSWQTIR